MFVFVALSIQHAMLMRHIVICGLSCSTFFLTFSHKRCDFRQKVIEHKIYVLSFSSNLSEIFLILRINGQNMIKDVYMSLCKVPIIHVRF